MKLSWTTRNIAYKHISICYHILYCIISLIFSQLYLRDDIVVVVVFVVVLVVATDATAAAAADDDDVFRIVIEVDRVGVVFVFVFVTAANVITIDGDDW